MQMALLSRSIHFANRATEKDGQAHLEVGHGYAVVHAVAGLLDGLEEVGKGPQVDAGLRVHAQHGVGLPCSCGRRDTP